jgi:hypothetical protein
MKGRSDRTWWCTAYGSIELENRGLRVELTRGYILTILNVELWLILLMKLRTRHVQDHTGCQWWNCNRSCLLTVSSCISTYSSWEWGEWSIQVNLSLRQFYIWTKCQVKELMKLCHQIEGIVEILRIKSLLRKWMSTARDWSRASMVYLLTGGCRRKMMRLKES